jgi:hypothetical protein
MSKRNDPFTYVAKYVAKEGGDLHFGGTLQHVNFSDFRKSLRRHGRKEVVHSANLDWRFFHLNDPRRKK